jgi:hypothetical protein
MVSEDFPIELEIGIFPADYPHSEGFHCHSILRPKGEYLEILGLSSIWPDLLTELQWSSSIVTAAVYRGFGLELRTVNRANPAP